MIFITKNSTLKKKLGAGRGMGGLYLVNFFHKESKSKTKYFGRGWGGGGKGGVDGWTDEQTQTNLPLQLLRRWWHSNALMYKLCP